MSSKSDHLPISLDVREKLHRGRSVRLERQRLSLPDSGRISSSYNIFHYVALTGSLAVRLLCSVMLVKYVSEVC